MKNKLPVNVRVGRNGRVGILKKVPRDLWDHPQYGPRAKVIERSTGAVDLAEGVRIAEAMLRDLEQEFAAARKELSEITKLAAANALSEASDDETDHEALPHTTRKRSAEDTRQEILSAAMEEFADKGLSGARVDAIAGKTSITKPMIYYHFGSKEKLYAAVMEEAYGSVRSKEQDLQLDRLPAQEAMRRLVEVSFDHHAEQPEYVRLVSVENIEMGRHITGRSSLVQRNAIAIDTVRSLLERGEKEGCFRKGIDPWHLHFLISSYCFMRVSNRYSFRAVFEKDLWDENDVPAQRDMIVEVVLRYVQK